jgi:hypothetical protein
MNEISMDRTGDDERPIMWGAMGFCTEAMKKDNLSPYPSNPGFIVGVSSGQTDRTVMRLAKDKLTLTLMIASRMSQNSERMRVHLEHTGC